MQEESIIDAEVIFKKIEKEDNKSMNKKDYTNMFDSSITQYKTDIALKTLMEAFDQGLYVLPKYQRQFTWTKEQVENLAVSLMRGLPIPPIYVYRNQQNKLEIIDGYQRLLSLFLYYKGKYIKNKKNIQFNWINLTTNREFENGDFLKKTTYKLKYIENGELKIININYDNLPYDIQNNIDFSTISVVEIKIHESQYKNRMLYKICENLNSHGTRFSNQELRNITYQCEFYDMLHEINDLNSKWIENYRKNYKYSRYLELLLRFCAIQHFSELKNGEIELYNYENSYPKLLNDFSDEAINFNQETILNYKNNIKRFINRIDFSERMPNLLIESLYLASTYIDGEYKIQDDICNLILKSDEFKDGALSYSASKVNVKERFNYVYRELSKYVEGNKQ